jgi:hypothetical protein
MYVPKEQIEEIGPMTLTATIDDYQMAPETFSNGGSVTFSRDLPPQLLDTNILPVQFSFDRAAPPSARDSRELGMVLSDVGLDTR